MELKLNGANYNKPYPPKEGATSLPQPNPEVVPEVVIQEVVKEVVREVPVHVAAPVVTEHKEELVMKKEDNVEITHTTHAPAIVPAVSGAEYTVASLWDDSRANCKRPCGFPKDHGRYPHGFLAKR